ncbi:hypothetical protein J7K93_09930 [bacterium]|nr:hypothetical protein [bacterium]
MGKGSYIRDFIIFVVIAAVAFLAVWRKLQIDKIPFEKVLLNASEEYESIKIPPRPGLQGITITGEVIQPLVFSIIGKATVTALDWNRLNSHAVVKITAWIDERGRLFINEMRSGGHTEAGLLIQDALQTWIYTPYKTGIIKFFFNLPSKGKKLIIDTSGLRRKDDIPPDKPIYDGHVYFINGVKPSEVGIGTFQ